MGWTEAQTLRLSDLMAQGLTNRQAAAAINKEFGTEYTRNAVIGRASRKKIVKKQFINAPSDRPKRERRPAHPRPAREPYTPAPLPDIASPMLTVETPPPAGIFGDTPRMIDLMDLQPHSCRFPFGDAAPFQFCGAHKHKGFPYCAEHVALTHNAGAGR